MTTIDYEAMNRELPKLRAALTRAKTKRDPLKILSAVEDAVEAFTRIGWPDQWATWRVALDDAYWAYRRTDAYFDDQDEGGAIGQRFERCMSAFAW